MTEIMWQPKGRDRNKGATLGHIVQHPGVAEEGRRRRRTRRTRSWSPGNAPWGNRHDAEPKGIVGIQVPKPKHSRSRKQGVLETGSARKAGTGQRIRSNAQEYRTRRKHTSI